jgi:alpha-1,2-mannosyltransferase
LLFGHLNDRPINPEFEKRLGVIAWGAWLVVLFFVSALIWVAPLQRSDCLTYYLAARNWWQGTNLFAYNFNIDGFLYFPQFAIIYTPFKLLGIAFGQIVWRMAGWTLLTWGIWRFAKILSPRRTAIMFALATAAALPPSVASLRNGEANLHIAAFMLLAAADLSERKWGWASFWLTLGLMVKPIMIVMLLLSAAVYRPLIWRLAIAILLAVAFPFALQRPEYVMEQYRGYIHWTMIATGPPNLFCNIRGLFGCLGWVMSQPMFKIIGAVAAAGMLGLSLIAGRTWKEPWRALFVMGYAAVYLMLFNPRTEANSYVILAPVVALPAAVFVISIPRPRIATILYIIAFMLICDAWAYQQTKNWLKPLACVVMFGLMVWEMLDGAAQAEVAVPIPSHPQALSPELQ